MAIVFLLTLLGATGLVGLAVWPGMFEDAIIGIPFCCGSFPLLVCWLILVAVLALRDLIRRHDPVVKRPRWGLRSAGVILAAAGLLWFHIPQHLVFPLVRSELQALAEAAPSVRYDGERVDRQIGPYWIDRYGADRRGGVFLRTHIGPDGFGPDAMSYGFAFRPKGQGTPFGNAGYQHCHLYGDWSVFAASNDWQHGPAIIGSRQRPRSIAPRA